MLLRMPSEQGVSRSSPLSTLPWVPAGGTLPCGVCQRLHDAHRGQKLAQNPCSGAQKPRMPRRHVAVSRRVPEGQRAQVSLVPPHSAAPSSPLREPSPPAFPAELRDPGEGHSPGATEAQGGQEDGPEGQLCPGLPAPPGPQQVAAQHAF